MKLKRAICSLALALALSGCVSDGCQPLPAVRQWSKKDQIELVKEVNATPPDSMVRVMRYDWETMRRALR